MTKKNKERFPWGAFFSVIIIITFGIAVSIGAQENIRLENEYKSNYCGGEFYENCTIDLVDNSIGTCDWNYYCANGTMIPETETRLVKR